MQEGMYLYVFVPGDAADALPHELRTWQPVIHYWSLGLFAKKAARERYKALGWATCVVKKSK